MTWHDPAWSAGEAVDSDFADALLGDAVPREWNHSTPPGVPVGWEWPWLRGQVEPVEVVLRRAGNGWGPPDES
jgi:hypothetical protein